MFRNKINKKKKKKKRKEKKRTTKEFRLVSLSVQITQELGHIRQKKKINMSGYLKDVANFLTYSEM